MTTEEPTNPATADELRPRATLNEYEFTDDAPGEGWQPAWLRAAWNSMATKWQARPVMAQQSAFNHALADWLERSLGEADLEARLWPIDRQATRLNAAVGLPAARARRLGHRAANPAHGDRLRVAYFSPMPPLHSGIGDYSAALLPYLAELADVTVFTDSSAAASPDGIAILPTARYPFMVEQFDLPLYQMGNSTHHETMYGLMLRHPGIVVLHDYFLHHFIYHHTAAAGDWTAYTRELSYAQGSGGWQAARAIRTGLAPAPLFEMPMNRRIIDSALGLIVHSRYAAGRARQTQPGVPLAVIPAIIETRPGRTRRAQLNLPDDALLFASYGFNTPEKRIEETLIAFRQLLATHKNSHFLLVGEGHPAIDPATEPELASHVHYIDYVDGLDAFVDWIHTADVVVNLRWPTVGETSAIALRAMAAARPLIVNDHGWYAELPDAAARKAPPADTAALTAAMAELAGDADLRRSMGEAGYAYVRRHCAPPNVARAYFDFMHDVLARGER